MIGIVIVFAVALIALILVGLYVFLYMEEQNKERQSQLNRLNDAIILLRDQATQMQSELDRVARRGDRVTLTRTEAECILASLPGTRAYFGPLDMLSDNDLIKALYHTEAFDMSVEIELEG